MNMKLVLIMLMAAMGCQAQPSVTVAPAKVVGSKAVVPLSMKNGFAEKIESAKAACFLLDEQGKMVGQSTRWVVGGNKETPGLAAGTTNSFHFVITSSKPFSMTHLTVRVQFSRVILEGGKIGGCAEGSAGEGGWEIAG